MRIAERGCLSGCVHYIICPGYIGDGGKKKLDQCLSGMHETLSGTVQGTGS